MVTVTQYKNLIDDPAKGKTIPKPPVADPSQVTPATGDYSQYISMGPDGPTWTGPQYVRDGNRMRRGGEILQDYKRSQLYQGYTDPQGNAISGFKTIYNQGGSTNPNGSISPQITHNRTSPETHPWLYPQGQLDPMAGKNYAEADWAPGGVAQGFPEIPRMSWQDRQAAADSQNFFKTGEGVDPNLLAGMLRVNPRTGPDANRDVFSNQFGRFQMPGWETDSRGNVEFFGSNFQGQDQQGNAVNYTGAVPYGREMQAATRDFFKDEANTARQYQGPGGSPSGSGGGSGGINRYDPGKQFPVGNRGWQNSRGAGQPRGVPGINVGNSGLPNTPAMTALQRALMGRWGG